MIDLQIAYIDYSLNTRSIDVFVNGCNGNCKGCCNPEIKDWSVKGMSIYKAIDKVESLNNDFNRLVDKIIIVGGDPVDAYDKNPEDLLFMLHNIKNKTSKPIYLFTRHKLDDVCQNIKNIVDYIKVGEYLPELTVDDNIQFGIKLATSNQKIYKKFNNEWRLENEF